MERQNIQAIAACGNGTVLMASHDIRDEMSGCEILRYNAESGEKALFAALPSLPPESLLSSQKKILSVWRRMEPSISAKNMIRLPYPPRGSVKSRP